MRLYCEQLSHVDASSLRRVTLLPFEGATCGGGGGGAEEVLVLPVAGGNDEDPKTVSMLTLLHA